MAETNGNGKKPRAKRRNYERELAELKQYCEIKRDVLHSLDKDGADEMIARIEAYDDILGRIERGA